MNADLEDNSEIIRAKKRRLNALNLQAARYGINAPPEVSIEIEDLEKEIRQLERTYSATMPPTPSPPTQGSRLTFAQKSELTNALLNCSSISNRNNLNLVLRQLRPEISSRIDDNSQPFIQVFNIVETCLNYPHGLEDFIAVLRAFEGASTPRQELDAVLSRILPSFPNG